LNLSNIHLYPPLSTFGKGGAKVFLMDTHLVWRSHLRFGEAHLWFGEAHLRFGEAHLRFGEAHLRFGKGCNEVKAKVFLMDIITFFIK